MTTVTGKMFENGGLYAHINGNRQLIANCNPIVNVYEESTTMKMKGSGVEYTVKSCHMTLVVCNYMKFMAKVDIPFLEKVSSFDVEFQYPQENGIMRKISFYEIAPKEIDLNGAWIFDVTGYADEVKALFPDLVFS